MNDLQSWSTAQQVHQSLPGMSSSHVASKVSRRQPFMLGGRPWWSAAGRLASIIVVLLAIATESLIIARNAGVHITDQPANDNSSRNRSSDSTSSAGRRTDWDEYAEDEDFASNTVRLLRRAANNTQPRKGSNTTALGGNPHCQWVRNTDVQDNPSGIPLSVSYHLLTMIFLAVLLLAEVHLWTKRLHASAMLNIGLVQLWAALACLSRTVNDPFSSTVGYALLFVGLTNIGFGFVSRFSVNGPGYSIFGTGNASAAENSAAALLPVANQSTRRGKGRHAVPPDPAEEMAQAEKISSIQQSIQGTHLAGASVNDWTYGAQNQTQNTSTGQGVATGVQQQQQYQTPNLQSTQQSQDQAMMQIQAQNQQLLNSAQQQQLLQAQMMNQGSQPNTVQQYTNVQSATPLQLPNQISQQPQYFPSYHALPQTPITTINGKSETQPLLDHILASGANPLSYTQSLAYQQFLQQLQESQQNGPTPAYTQSEGGASTSSSSKKRKGKEWKKRMSR